jgi:hypothetical protein
VALPEKGALAGVAGEHAQLAGSHDMTGGQRYTTGDVPGDLATYREVAPDGEET